MPRAPLLVATALALLTLLVFAPVFSADFLNYDDDLYVSDRPELRAGLGAESFRWALTSTQGANWFPATRLSWLLDAELFGLSPRAFHLSNLLLHVAAALLLFVALLRMTGQLWPSAFSAALFAIHPLHVEPVAWVSSRKDVLSAACFGLVLLAHERRARGGRPRLWSAATAGALALGLAAKPMLVTAPFVLLLLDHWPLRRLYQGGALVWRRLPGLLLEKLPLFALAAAACWITLEAQRAGGALQDALRYPLAMRVETALDALLAYLGQFFWPRELAAFYPHPHGSVSVDRILVAVAVLGVLSGVALRRWRRQPYLAVGWLWFLGMLVPVLGLVQVGQAARADRYSYLPLVGLALALAWGARDVGLRWPALGPWLRRAAALLLALLAVASFDQASVWRNSRTLFEHALAVTEHNHVAHINLGHALAVEGRLEEAEAQLTRGLAIAPASAVAPGLRGEVRLALDRPDEAERDFRAALSREPESARWAVGLGRALLEQERWAEAEAALRPALEREPDRPEARLMLGSVLMNQGRAEEGAALYRSALADEATLLRRLRPGGVARSREQLAQVLHKLGRPEEALAELEAALRLAPDRAALHGRRAALLAELGREAEALAGYEAALEAGGPSVRALNNLAWLLLTARETRLRDPARALALAEDAARRSQHADPSVLDSLSLAQARVGREEEARRTALRAAELADAQGLPALARTIRDRIR